MGLRAGSDIMRMQFLDRHPDTGQDEVGITNQIEH